MKVLLTFTKLLLSVLLQIALLPLRLISWTLKVIETVFRIVRGTNNHLINTIVHEVLK